MRAASTKALVPRARAMRRGQTPAERKLWFEYLRTAPVKFQRQLPLYGYILDFYALALKLCVELDGRSHDTAEAGAYDAERTRCLSAAGIQGVRFSNAEVLGQFDSVWQVIEALRQGEAPF